MESWNIMSLNDMMVSQWRQAVSEWTIPLTKSVIYEYGSHIATWIVLADIPAAYLMSDIQVVTFNQWDAVSNSISNNSLKIPQTTQFDLYIFRMT